MNDPIKVAVDVFVIRGGKILLGKRKGAYGEGDWGMPGGHVEYREKLAETARRELFEETGMTAKSFAFENLVNNTDKNKHYVHASFLAVDPAGEPKLTEPDRCYEWRWFDLKALPANIFEAQKRHLEAYLSGRNFIE